MRISVWGLLKGGRKGAIRGGLWIRMGGYISCWGKGQRKEKKVRARAMLRGRNHTWEKNLLE